MSKVEDVGRSSLHRTSATLLNRITLLIKLGLAELSGEYVLNISMKSLEIFQAGGLEKIVSVAPFDYLTLKFYICCLVSIF